MTLEDILVTTALIGYTGLVGGNLLRQARFDDLYNSKNIEDIAGKHYATLVCAGAPAQKWLANREPERDRACLDRLRHALETVSAERVLLISTVDVFPTPIDVDEETPLDRALQHPYGRHRHELEQFVQKRFASLVVRLPGLFGPGLKKNILFDFLHHNQVDQVHADASFQFYNLERLWADVQRSECLGVGLIHFATEPITVHEVARHAFGIEFNNRPSSAPARYDFRSRHADRLGGTDGYLYRRREVLDEIRAFVENERKNQHASRHFQPGLAA
jgi:nucleoside-diphosphate-sugar epimerase